MSITINNKKWEISSRSYKSNHLIQEINYQRPNHSILCSRLKSALQPTWLDIFVLKQLKECLLISINSLSSMEEDFPLLLPRSDLVLEIRLLRETDLSELDSSKWQKLSILSIPKIKNTLNSNTLPILSCPYIVLNINKT